MCLCLTAYLTGCGEAAVKTKIVKEPYPVYVGVNPDLIAPIVFAGLQAGPIAWHQVADTLGRCIAAVANKNDQLAKVRAEQPKK